jgi:hypothetical protein
MTETSNASPAGSRQAVVRGRDRRRGVGALLIMMHSCRNYGQQTISRHQELHVKPENGASSARLP